MPGFRPYLDFTPQARAFASLNSLRRQLATSKHPADHVPIVVFMAFSIEAYINWIGARHIEFWNEIERIAWRQKIEVLHKDRGHKADWGSEPLQFAVEIFSLRDKLAHGKPERVNGAVHSTEQAAYNELGSHTLEPAWYSNLTPSWLASATSRHLSLIQYLGGIYDLHSSDHQLYSTGGVEPVA